MKGTLLMVLWLELMLSCSTGSAAKWDSIPTNRQTIKAASEGKRTSSPPPLPEWATSQPFLSQPYTSMTRVFPTYRIYHNLWFHNQRWYAFQPPEEMSDPSLEEGLSVNLAVVRTPVTDISTFVDNLRVGYVPGNSLLVDYPFLSLADHLGHWAEIIIPTYNVIKSKKWLEAVDGGSKKLDRVVLVNLNRHLNSWFEQFFILALAPGHSRGREMPPTIDYSDLDKYDKLGWVVFENVLVIQDRFTHPQLRKGFAGSDHGDLWRFDGCDRYVAPNVSIGFATPEDGQGFRLAAYESQQWDAPEPWVPGYPPKLPKFITLMTHSEEYPGIVNIHELLDMLHDIAPQFGLRAQMISLTTAAPFVSQLDFMSQTALLIGRHGPLFANSLLLPPGAAALELLPFKWEWHKLSMLFYNQTQSMGDIHHWAWRPTDRRFCKYKECPSCDFREKNDARYHAWTPDECHAWECLSAHARAELIVDLPAVRELLLRKLPGVMAGKPVDSLREPWPIAV